jgi:ABC-2 type transport system ATP-binding protein
MIWQCINRREWLLTLYPYSTDAVGRLADANPVSGIEVFDLSLEDIFKDLIRGKGLRC